VEKYPETSNRKGESVFVSSSEMSFWAKRRISDQLCSAPTELCQRSLRSLCWAKPKGSTDSA